MDKDKKTLIKLSYGDKKVTLHPDGKAYRIDSNVEFKIAHTSGSINHFGQIIYDKEADSHRGNNHGGLAKRFNKGDYILNDKNNYIWALDKETFEKSYKTSSQDKKQGIGQAIEKLPPYFMLAKKDYTLESSNTKTLIKEGDYIVYYLGGPAWVVQADKFAKIYKTSKSED